MPIGLQFDLDETPLRRCVEAILHGMEASDGPLRDAYRQAGLRYLVFIRRRFLTASRGDGTWPDLSPATKRARVNKGRAKREFNRRLKRAMAGDARTRRHAISDVLSGMSFQILRDSGILFNSLSQGSPGNINEDIAGGVRVGTAIEYAMHHQAGGASLPQREILVAPDQPTTELITGLIERGLQRLIQQSVRESGT